MTGKLWFIFTRSMENMTQGYRESTMLHFEEENEIYQMNICL